MKNRIKELKESHSLKIDERKVNIPGAEPKTFYLINGLDKNESTDFYIRESQDIDILEELIEKKPYFYNDFIGVYFESTIQIPLSTVSFRSHRAIDRDDEGKEIISVKINYFKNDLEIKVRYATSDDLISKYSQILRGARRFSRRTPLIIEINNLSKPTVEGIENDTRNILNSVLFDIEYTYGLGFETINIDSLTRRFFRRNDLFDELPLESVNLVYKKYIPELIEYFHIGEKVDYLPFKFICYYHIIEYFSDKSAYHVVSGYLKNLLLKPDFHTKTNHYVNQAINFFKKESDRYTSDKIKVERVLRQFVDRTELKEVLENLEILEHFEKTAELECSKTLNLPKIDFNTDSNFYLNLTKRIYSVRCSIVHSNPDFDETKAIPFVPTAKNMDILRMEIELVLQISKMIIIGSKE
tara:strand:- start:1417 stop:2655 length:1239 start_codon:yes stop_codon:yes gene_type:complete